MRRLSGMIASAAIAMAGLLGNLHGAIGDMAAVQRLAQSMTRPPKRPKFRGRYQSGRPTRSKAKRTLSYRRRKALRRRR